MANKIIDINSQYGGAASQSNVSNYDFNLDKYKQLRSPKLDFKKLFTPSNVQAMPDFIINTYKFNGLEFGNWVNQTRRLDYCLSTIIACYDLQKVLGLKNNNLGLNKSISLSFGARGSSMAYAHYEPYTRIINLSRDRRIDKIKNINKIKVYAPYKEYEEKVWNEISNNVRENNSGYGSLAHEYGHALDYCAAEYFTNGRSTGLSGGTTVLYSYENKNNAYNHFVDAIGNKQFNALEQSFFNCFEPFLFRNQIPTSFYKKVYDYSKKRGKYWARLNEIWARIFETYVAYKLYKLGVKDKYLVRDGKGKYRDELKKDFGRVYPTFGEMQTHYKKIDLFILEINKNL